MLGSCRRAILAVAVAAVTLVLAGPVWACGSGSGSTTVQDTEWVVEIDNWFTDANWTYAAPTNHNTGFINNWGEANIEAAWATAGNLVLGNAADGGGTVVLWAGGGLVVQGSEKNGLAGYGTVLQYGGTHYVCYGNLTHGDAAGGFGTYFLTDGLLSVWHTEYLGRDGAGAFYQTGGTHTISCGGLVVASGVGSTGAYSLDAGTLTVNCSTIIGDAGSGAFSMTAGTVHLGSLTLADEFDSDGAFSMFDGTLKVGGSEVVGDRGLGSFEQYAGTHTICGNLTLSNDASATASFALMGGTLIVSGNEVVGQYGTAALVQVAGTHEVGDAMLVGGKAGSFGMFSIAGGSLAVKQLRIGDDGEYGLMDIAGEDAYLEVTKKLAFGEKAVLSAVSGSAIYFTGTAVTNTSTDAYSLEGLANVSLVIDTKQVTQGRWGNQRRFGMCGRRGWFGMWRWGWACGNYDEFDITTVEAAGADLGADASGFIDNFALGSLIIGDTEESYVKLVDNTNNGNRGAGGEVLYVHDITVAAGSTLDLRYAKVYYDGTLDNQGTILGTAPIAVP
jgi:hypothetical protein